MKKVIKSRIFLVIITTIVVASISVYAATTYKASEVLYTSSDESSMTVNEALNELYNKSNDTEYPDIKIYYNSGWYSGTCSINVSFNIPSGYNYLSLTNNSTTKTRIDSQVVYINPGEKYSVSEKDKETITIYGSVNSNNQCIASGAVVISH